MLKSIGLIACASSITAMACTPLRSRSSALVDSGGVDAGSSAKDAEPPARMSDAASNPPVTIDAADPCAPEQALACVTGGSRERLRCRRGTWVPSEACPTAALICTGAGTCVECLDHAQCTQPSNPCAETRCEAGACVTHDNDGDSCPNGMCIDGTCVNPDMDDDGLENDQDNCPDHANTSQHDLDGDGMGYACDADDEVVAQGTLNDWPENDFVDLDERAGAQGNGTFLWWTLRDASSVWFYGDDTDLQVAVTSFDSIAAITDADSLSYTFDRAAADVGSVVVWRNIDAGTYAAGKLESLVDNGASGWRCTLTWQYAGHSKDFSGF